MKQDPSLDDVALFLAVADAGGLSGAAERTGASVPTLSRRMAALERALGVRLFDRGKRGYALTLEGRSYLERAEPLRAIAARLGRAPGDGPTRVRITAGLWTSRFLARTIASVWQASDPWVPEFLASNAVVDVARRAADIGIRNRRPDQTWLAGRKTAEVTYAAYAAPAARPGYIALSEGPDAPPSSRWLWDHHRAEIVSTVSDGRLALDLALSGLGAVVVPTFAGDDTPGLGRIGPPIDALTHEEWLVSHHDGRHDAPVRAALDALTEILTNPNLRPVSKRAP